MIVLLDYFYDIIDMRWKFSAILQKSTYYAGIMPDAFIHLFLSQYNHSCHRL